MKSKKILLGSLSTMALVATPIAAVVSCDKKDPAAAATGDKKAAFQAADLIKKIGKDDKGLIATIQFMGEDVKLYVSEADAKTETTVSDHGIKIVLPILTKGQAGMKAKVTMSEDMIQKSKSAIQKGPGTTQQKQDQLDKLVPEQEVDVITNATTAKVGALVINKNIIADDVTDAAKTLTKLLTVKDGKGLYPFAFTPETEEKAIPELTVESKKAFTKIFTDLGLIVKSLAFANDKTAKTITPTFTLAEDTSVADLAALKTAFGTTLSIDNAGHVIAAAGAREIKSANTTKNVAKVLDELNLPFLGNGFVAPSTLTDSLIKDNMKIEFVITKGSTSSADGQGKLLITTPTVTTPTEITFVITH